MIANYHNHTSRSHHGTGMEREYIERAISSGFQTLGFSEHAPYRFLHGYTSWWHLQPDEMEDYVSTVLAARKEYKDDIQILLGVEAEYYPETFDFLLEELAAYPLDYMIFGQHAFGNEYNRTGTYEESDSPLLLKEYVDTCITALETGIFTYIAHPDMFSFTGPEALYEREMGRLCSCCSVHEIPMEVNLKGVSGSKRYPSVRFFRLARKYNCKFVAGLDAHAPEQIVQPEKYERYNTLIRICDLKIEERIPLICPAR